MGAAVRTTERLRLEPITAAHADDLYRLHLDPAIAEWWAVTWDREDAEREAQRFADGWVADGISKWMAYDLRSGELIGRGGITVVELGGSSCHEVGWAVLGEHWGRGYATEIGRTALDLAFVEVGVDDVVAFTEPHNVRSRAVMGRLGLTYRDDFERDGDAYVLYGIRREDAMAAVSPDR